MKTAIIYKSYLGATKQYAEWLSQEAGADLHTFNSVSPEELKNYDTIVVASGTYASFMPLNRFLKKNWPSIENKKVIVVAVGMVPADDPGSKISYERIPAPIREKITYIKIPGKFGQKTESNIKKENLQPVLEAIGK